MRFKKLGWVLAGVAAFCIGGFLFRPTNSKEKTVFKEKNPTVCVNYVQISRDTRKEEYIESERKKGIETDINCVIYSGEIRIVNSDRLEKKVDNVGGVQKKVSDIERYAKEIDSFDPYFKKLIDEYCGQEGIDLPLCYSWVYTESGFDKDAVSKVGAVGLTQLMPRTARKKKLNVPFYRLVKKNINGDEIYVPQCNKEDFKKDPKNCDLKKDERFNSKKNLRAGISHLRDLLNENNNIRLALAEYNAGDSALKNSRARSCWGQRRFECKKNGVYDETREYIEMIMNRCAYYRQILQK